jgi:small subunit ribosomal protein S20
VKNLPNIKSAKKRVIVTEVKTLQNKMLKTALRTAMKKYEAAVAAGDKEAATKAYAVAVKKLDVAASKGIVHKNNAARKKSQYTLMLNKMGA